jgi:hypothetical protein
MENGRQTSKNPIEGQIWKYFFEEIFEIENFRKRKVR